MATAVTTTVIVEERENEEILKTQIIDSSRFIRAYRPWHSLYGVRLRLQTASQEPEKELSLIQKLLPNEILALVFARLPITSLGKASMVCRQWSIVSNTPSLWRVACTDAFRDTAPEKNERILFNFHRGNWKEMFMDRCHLRFDGVYCSRNTYVRQGTVEWKNRKPVHFVQYFRYFRFFPDGTLLYRTSPETVSKVAKSMMMTTRRAPPTTTTAVKNSSSNDESLVHSGRYKLVNDKLYTALRYDNSTSTEVRSKMKLRSTVRGAMNRLDIESIVSYDREDGSVVPMGAPLDEDDDGGDDGVDVDVDGVERRRYSRGMASYVFIPWDAVNTHILNSSVDKMDVYIPG